MMLNISPNVLPPSVDSAATRLTTPMLSDSVQVTLNATPAPTISPVVGDTWPTKGGVESGDRWSISRSLDGSAETGRFTPSYAVTLIRAWAVGNSGTSQLKLLTLPLTV